MQMTELQAWTMLAALWGSWDKKENGLCAYLQTCESILSPTMNHLANNWYRRGMCFAISNLLYTGYISNEVWNVMKRKVQEGNPDRTDTEGECYFWSIDGHGARMRSAFCKRQAQKITIPKSKRKGDSNAEKP